MLWQKAHTYSHFCYGYLQMKYSRVKSIECWRKKYFAHLSPFPLYHFQHLCVCLCAVYNIEFVLSLFKRSCMTTVSIQFVATHSLHLRSFTSASHIYFPIIVLRICSIPQKTGNFWFSASSLTDSAILRTVELKPSEPYISPNLIIISSMKQTNDGGKKIRTQPAQLLQQVLQKCCVFHVLKMPLIDSSLIWHRSIEFYTRSLL